MIIIVWVVSTNAWDLQKNFGMHEIYADQTF